MEFSKLLDPCNFKATLIQSFDNEMNELGEVAKHVHISMNKERDVLFQEFKATTEQHKTSNNVPLLMTSVVAPLYFDPKLTRFQRPPNKGMVDNEIESPECEYKRGR